nr:deleted in azoospermia-like [Nothobranchius furzeri]
MLSQFLILRANFPSCWTPSFDRSDIFVFPGPIVSHLVGPITWTSPSGYVYCPCCSPVGGGMTQPSPIPSGRTHYNQPYSYNNFGEVVFPLMSTNYSHGPYYQPLTMQYTTAPWTPDRPTQLFNQSFVDCGVQTVL